MKFLFAVPPFSMVLSMPPYGISLIATIAKNAGLDVSMHLPESTDEAMSEFEQKLIKRVRDEKFDVVCFGGMSSNYPLLKRLILLCNNESCITVLGGNIVDPQPELIAENIGATYCVIGEAEETFNELAFALIEGKRDLSEIAGLIYKDGNNLIKTKARKVLPNLDILPYCDESFLNREKVLEMNSEVIIIGSRSCPYKCTFCYHLKGSYYRARSLDHLFGEIDYLLEKYKGKIKSLRFMDEMLNENKERLLEFCKRIKKYQLAFMVQTRIDVVDEESLIALKDAGCYQVTYGIESANNRVLKSMKKNITKELLNEKIDLTAKIGLQIQGSVIMGDIEEDIDSVNETIHWALSKSATVDIFFSAIMIFPGTYLYKYAMKNGIIKDELKFLEAGCPPINVTKLTDDQYWLMRDKSTNYNIARTRICERPLNKKHITYNLKKDGSVDYTAYCPKCFTKIEFKNIVRDISYGIFLELRSCPNCNARLTLTQAEYISRTPDSHLIGYLAEQVFEKYKGSRIAIWGINSSFTRRLLLESQILRDCLVKIVDSNYTEFSEETHCGLSVEGIESLKEVEFDYIIISSERSKAAILDKLKEMGINVPVIEMYSTAYSIQSYM